ncbi:MAG: hypothetical protein ABIH23_00760 [bacterium]
MTDPEHVKGWIAIFKQLPLWLRRIVVLVLLVGVVGWLCYEYVFVEGLKKDLKAAQTQNRLLDQENKELKADNRLLRTEIEGLRETVAPLVKQAMEQFPGEEINKSLEKIVAKMEEDKPSRKPIANVETTVRITIQSEDNTNTIITNRGGVLAFLRGNSTLLIASSTSSKTRCVVKGELTYSSELKLEREDMVIGKPINFLKAAEYIRLQLGAVPANSLVLRGEIIVVLNGGVRLRFNVPPQRAIGNNVFIKDLSDGLGLLEN